MDVRNNDNDVAMPDDVAVTRRWRGDGGATTAVWRCRGDAAWTMRRRRGGSRVADAWRVGRGAIFMR